MSTVVAPIEAPATADPRMAAFLAPCCRKCSTRSPRRPPSGRPIRMM